MRKKARYQELLDNEKKLEEISLVDALNECRRHAVVGFIHLCGQIICDSHGMDESRRSDVAGKGSIISALEEFVVDIQDFSFESGAERPQEDEGFARLLIFQETMGLRVRSRVNEFVLPSLVFSVSGSSNGVALSGDDSAFALAELTHPSHCGCLIQGIFRFKFATDSDKLRSASWTLVKDLLGKVDDGLNIQVSHPSVVSLEPSSANDHTDRPVSSSTSVSSVKFREEDAAGPGMTL
jgi:hypothetical protein